MFFGILEGVGVDIVEALGVDGVGSTFGLFAFDFDLEAWFVVFGFEGHVLDSVGFICFVLLGGWRERES